MKRSKYNHAHQKVAGAIRSGRLPSLKNLLCTHCTRKARLWHHYSGYDGLNWLSVVALCTKCHGEAHKKLRKQL